MSHELSVHLPVLKYVGMGPLSAVAVSSCKAAVPFDGSAVVSERGTVVTFASLDVMIWPDFG